MVRLALVLPRLLRLPNVLPLAMLSVLERTSAVVRLHTLFVTNRAGLMIHLLHLQPPDTNVSVTLMVNPDVVTLIHHRPHLPRPPSVLPLVMLSALERTSAAVRLHILSS